MFSKLKEILEKIKTWIIEKYNEIKKFFKPKE